MSIEIAEIGPRDSYGIGEADDQIMMLEGFLGNDLDAAPPRRTGRGGAKDDTPQKLFWKPKIVEGPQFWVGPFLLKADRKGPYSIHVPVSKMRKRADYKKFGTWAMGRVQKYSKKSNPLNVKVNGTDMSKVMRKNGKYMASPVGHSRILPKRDGSRCPPELLGVCIPDDQFIDKRYINGSRPIAKFDHPLFKRSGGGKENWGMFLTLVPAKQTGDKNHSGPATEHFKFTFKKVAPGFWGKLWDWLAKIFTEIIATVVDLLKSIIEGLLDYACSLATPLLREIEQAAKAKTKLSASTRDKLAKNNVGIGADSIDTLIAGGTVVGVRQVGEAVIGALCGEDAPQSPPLKTESDISPLVIAAGLSATVGVLYYFFVA